MGGARTSIQDAYAIMRQYDMVVVIEVILTFIGIGLKAKNTENT